MSVYFSHRVVVPPVEQGQASYLDVSWHPHCSILAVVSRYESSGAVFFCHDEGELIEDMNVTKPWFVESISWHPDKKFLAVGWKNGEITICNITDSDIHSHPPFHQTPVNILQWTNTGSHLISADISGVIAMWKVEPSGLLAKNPFQQAKLTGEITHCVLLSGASKALQTKFKSSDAVVCIFALKDGQLCLWNSGNKCTELENFHSLIIHLEYSTEKSLLAALTKTMVLVLMTTQNDSFQKLSEVKLGGQGIVSSMIWTLPGVLTTCSDEPLIRFWDTVDNENYSLSLKDYFTIGKEELHECVTAISYQSNGSYLSAGTNKGHVIIWYWNNDQWKFVTYFTLDQSINALSWEYSRRSLAMSHDSHVDIAIEHPIASHYNQEVSAVQVSALCVMVQSHANNSTVKFSTDIMISGIATTKTHTVVWDGKKVNVYSISFSKNLANMSGTFQSVATSVAIYEHSVFTVEEDHLIVRSVASVIKHKLSLAMEISGSVHLRISGHYLGLAVSNGYVKVYNLTRREPKLMCTKSLSQSVDGFRSVLSCQTNSNGTMISSIVKTVSDVSVMTLMNCDNETVKVLSFSQGRPSSISLPANLPEAIMKDQSKMLSQLNGGDVVMVHWDGNDPRLLAIEVQVDPNSRHSYVQKSPTHLVMLFITADMHFLVQEVSAINPEFYSTIGCNAPYVYYTTKNMAVPSLPAEANRGTDSIPLPAQRAPLKDFIGLGDCDEPMVKAMLSFSYSSLMGNMDDAFKAIKSIKNQRVWKTLAVMSVKTRRFDVALVCVGNMNDGRAAKAIREAQEIPEEDARLATLAVHLGMLDTAEELYISSGRYDLLNLFYQASGKWMKAIEVAEMNDRIHLKNTYYNQAKYYENVGQFKAAIQNYELSGTHQFEVVRMLMDDPDELLEYSIRSQDKVVQHFWAEHLECSGELDNALEQYRLCGDIQSMVRLLLYTQNEERAIRIVEETRDKGAAYHVAKLFAQSDELSRIKKAIQFYTMAECYSHAITVAQEFDLETELMNLALLSTKEDKIEVAKYFETRPSSKENSIELYYKAGELSKALDLCFQYRQYDILQQIAEELTVSSNPETIRKVAEYFVKQEQFEKAVQILLQSERAAEALEMCLRHHVIITEELAEKLTPLKSANESPEELKLRMETLEYLGDGLVSQRSYHLAAMKFTQAGNKIKAMKALLKSGDTERITFFANVSRQKEIYVMAANYLQSLNWRGNTDIMKNIIGFYTKGRAFETLANFYDTCAKAEIEEYQDYDRAQGALNEALIVLNKIKDVTSTLEDKKKFITRRLELIQKFNNIRAGYAEDREGSIKECKGLLEDRQVDVALRVGDVYAMIITHYIITEDYHQGLAYIDLMKKHIPGVNLKFYIKPQVLEALSNAMGTTHDRNDEETNRQKDEAVSDNDSIEEVVD